MEHQWKTVYESTPNSREYHTYCENCGVEYLSEDCRPPDYPATCDDMLVHA